jgi:large subunit ribosomal protein L25
MVIMSDSFALTVEPRETLGKQVRKIRDQGLVPAVVHNHGQESTHVQAEYQSLVKVVHGAGRHHPVELTVGGKKVTVLIRSVSRDPKLGTITHVVFNAVRANQKVEAEVPVKPKYAEGKENTPAERAGLIVLEQLDVVEVKALPKDLPDELYYDAEKLVAVGDHVTVADLIVPAGVEVETELAHAIASVFEPSALAAANEAAAGEAEEVAPETEETAEETPATEEAKE